MNDETLQWYRFATATPPEGVVLFVRLVDRIDAENRINFVTCIWKGKKLLCWVLPGETAELPERFSPTHWAMTEAANKVWFRYAWDDEEVKIFAVPNNGRIL